MSKPTFTRDQRRELRTMKLSPEQLDDLENMALPVVLAYVVKQPRKNEVKEELKQTSTSLKAAITSIERLLCVAAIVKSSQAEIAARDAALTRVIVASYGAGLHGDVLDNTLPPLRAAIDVIERAIKDLPKGATRHRTASHIPIGFIDDALLSGFLKANGHSPGLSGPNAGKALPHYSVERSYGDGTDYRRITEICYEAVGAGTGSREQAIRAFMKARERA